MLTSLVDVFPYFIKSSETSSNGVTKIQAKEFSLLNIIKLLSAIRLYDMTFSELYRSSNIIMKRSYLNYLDLCKHFDLIKQTKLQYSTVYSITEKGKILLDLFRI